VRLGPDGDERWAYAYGDRRLRGAALVGDVLLLGWADGTSTLVSLRDGAARDGESVGAHLNIAATGAGRAFVIAPRAVSRHDGARLLWTCPLPSVRAFAFSREVFAAGGGELVALDPESGAIRWRFADLPEAEMRLAAADGCVWIAERDGTLRAIRTAFVENRFTWQGSRDRGLPNSK
jgi:outer membrane protein assembly factor BamB